MPRRIALTGPDKAKGVNVDLRLQYDGDAVLTGKNKLENPRLDHFDINGDLEGWVLDSPPEETGYRPYVYGPGSSRFSAQGAAVPFSTPFVDQRSPLVNGDTPPDVTHRALVAPFAFPPTLQLVANSIKGFTAGWRGFAMAYGVGKGRGSKGRLTNCGPLVVAYIGEGQGATLTLPDSAPDGVTFVVIGMTKPFATEAAALNATQVFEQERIPTKPRLPTTRNLKGPFDQRNLLSFTVNQTQNGGLGKVRHKRRKKAGKSKNTTGAPKDTELSYSVQTEHGSSTRQGNVKTKIGEDEQVEFEPGDMPENAKTWTPFFNANTENVQSMNARKPGQKATLPSNDPSEVPGATTPTRANNPATDESGIDGPTSALEAPVPFGPVLPTPGWYSVIMTKETVDPDTGLEEESAPGPMAKINVPAGYYPRIRPPADYRNWIANPEATARKTDVDELPEDWDRLKTTNVQPSDDQPGYQRTIDTTGATTNWDAARTAPINVAGRPTATFHMRIRLQDFVTGRAHIVMQQTNTSGAVTETILGNYTGATDDQVTVRMADVAGNHINYVWIANIATVRFILRHVGAVGAPRNFVSVLWNPIALLGRKRPRKRKKRHPNVNLTKTQLRISPGEEPAEIPYPTFGYTVVVLDPPDADKPVAMAGAGAGNFVEYYGPNGTPYSSTYFMGGLRQPVKPGEVWTDSFYFLWEGVDTRGYPLKAVIKNASHVVLQDLGNFIPGGCVDFSEDQPDADANGWVRRSLTYVVPPGGAYVEYTPQATADGIYRIGWGQHEEGTAMTAWEDDHAPSGSLLSTFDLGVPGVPQGSMPTLSRVKRLLGFGAEVTPDSAAPEGTTTWFVEARSYDYGSPFPDNDTGWVSSLAELELRDVVEVRTTLNTSDVNYTPEFHSHFLDFERKFDMPGYGVFLRADGTEFNGGCTLYNFPPVQKRPPIVEEEYADGSRGFGVMGSSTRWVSGFGIECYLNSTAEEIMELIGEESVTPDDEDASVFIPEFEGKRYRVRVLAMDIQPDNREGHDPIPGMETDGKWILRAEAIEGEVLDEETM